MLALILFGLLVGLPIFEIFLLIEGAQAFGTITVILMTIGTAALGTLIIKRQGLSAMNRLREDLSAGQSPVAPVVDGVSLIVAAPLLMTPGFITDGFGFLLLVPFIRREIARMALRRLKRAQEEGRVVIMRR